MTCDLHLTLAEGLTPLRLMARARRSERERQRRFRRDAEGFFRRNRERNGTPPVSVTPRREDR